MDTEEFEAAVQRLVVYTAAGVGIAKFHADANKDERLGRRWSSVLRILADGVDPFLAGIADGALRASDARANDGMAMISVAIHKGCSMRPATRRSPGRTGPPT